MSLQDELRQSGFNGRIAAADLIDSLQDERDLWRELHRALLVEHLNLKKQVRTATKPIDPLAFGSPNGA